MQLFVKKGKQLFGMLAAGSLLLGACNHEFEDIGSETVVNPPSGSSMGDIINNDTSYSFFKALLTLAGPGAPNLSNKSSTLTGFIPNNNAFRASRIPSAAAIPAVFTAGSAASVTRYVVSPQALPLAQIPTTFPNFQSPTLLNPTAGTPAFNPLISLSIFPSRRGTSAWVNNVPLTGTTPVANGVIHNPAFLVIPPSTTLWSRISADADMSYFKAAVTRGDSGQVGTGRIDSLLNLPIGPNFTVFVPTNLSMQQLLTAQITAALVPRIAQQLLPVIIQQLIAAGATPAEAAAQAPALAAAQALPIAQGQATALASTPDVFTNPLLFSALTPQTVKGIVVYHMLGSRAFSVNLPTTATLVPTLLNSAIAAHPGVSVTATFAGPFVTGATVKGLGNPTPSTILINPSPAPAGSSDQHYLNGVLHKINQVLRPQ